LKAAVWIRNPVQKALLKLWGKEKINDNMESFDLIPKNGNLATFPS